jgi:two-component system, NtrC family, response regulator AtoC
MTHAIQIMAISNDTDVCNVIHNSLESEGHEAMCVPTAREAMHLLSRGVVADYFIFDAARNRSLDDLFYPDVLERITSSQLCILSELGDISWRNHATRWNIHTVLTKPLLRQDLERLTSWPKIAPPKPAVLPAPPEPTNSDFYLEELDNNRYFLAATPAMMQIYRDVRVLAPVDIPVLILGESGVGKEIVANLLHKYNPRAEKKFLNVNCAALPNELLESELFGYEAGAFTGAMKSKPGKFELAHKGTLLLDEIGEMSPQMQAKLLHVLQDGSFARLGARTTTQVDVRVLAATNINMTEAIAEKRFREDLFYRLNAFTISIPPLRERRMEIPFLMEQMMRRGAVDLGQQAFPFSDGILEAAVEYHWPGNLRELRNFVTRTLILQDQESALSDLRSKIRAVNGANKSVQATAPPAEMSIPDQSGMKSMVRGVKNETEIRLIQNALTASGWNRRRAATNLNISYRALLYKIQQHGLSV